MRSLTNSAAPRRQTMRQWMAVATVAAMLVAASIMWPLPGHLETERLPDGRVLISVKDPQGTTQEMVHWERDTDQLVRNIETAASLKETAREFRTEQIGTANQVKVTGVIVTFAPAGTQKSAANE